MWLCNGVDEKKSAPFRHKRNHSSYEGFLQRIKICDTSFCEAIARGGVEDTRLEAKAKDTKKSEAKAKDSLSEDRTSRGQGQECSRPRPRTEDTGASVLLRKKSLQKYFSGDLQFIGVPRIFD